MKSDGASLKQITTGHGDDREPRLSPDGTTIAFASDRAFKKSYDIWTVKVDGSGLKQITTSDADEFEPTWSPDGTHIAFVSGTGVQGRSIESIDLSTASRRPSPPSTLQKDVSKFQASRLTAQASPMFNLQVQASSLTAHSLW